MGDSQKLCLEDYLLFHDYPWRGPGILLSHLNRIIEMHGYVRIRKKPKSTVLESLNSIDIMQPSRSTLDHHTVFSPASLDADELAEDLAALGWQDFHIPSIQTLNSDTDLATLSPPTTSAAALSLRAPPATFVVAGRRPRTKRKRSSVNNLVAATEFPSQVLLPPPPPPPPFCIFVD